MINIISSILAAGALAAGAGSAGTALLMGGQKLGTGRLLVILKNSRIIGRPNCNKVT